MAIAIDSGASDNFGHLRAYPSATFTPGASVTMAAATGDSRNSIGTDRFNLPLPTDCLDYHVFTRDDLHRPLLSVGKACDAGCTVQFTAQDCQFHKEGKLLLQAQRDSRSGLYLVPTLPQRDNLLASAVAQANKHKATDAYTVPNLLRFLHGCAGFPVAATWIQAIRHGYYHGWPGLTAARVTRYLPKSDATFFGHLKLARQGTRSTKATKSTDDEETDINKNSNTNDDLAKSTHRKTVHELGRRRNVMVCSIPVKEIADSRDLSGIIGTDQTGRFPITSDRGHKYIFILFDNDVNLIYGVPIKSRKAGELVRAFKESYNELVSCGFEPILHRIDNETSMELTTAIRDKGLEYETVPPGNHRRNPAERAIQTFKSHFIAIMNGLDAGYPAGAWDLLMPQTNLTLNLLRSCNVNPSHSAYSYVYGPFDFNAHPLAPLGCRAIVHAKATGRGGKRGTWENRGRVGYYVGPAMRGYRVWRFYMPDTKAVIESDTAEFFPKAALPTMTVESRIAECLGQIEEALANYTPPHTSVSDSDEAGAVIARLRRMYEGPNDHPTVTQRQMTTPASPTRVTKTAVTPTRVTKTAVTPTRVPTNDDAPRINTYTPKKKQRFPIGSRVKVDEYDNGRKVSHIGKATGYDHVSGLYHIEFPDGEWEEFDDEEMEYFRLVKPFKGRKPTTYANQLTVSGFFPKASSSSANVQYGLNAGSIWDEELHKWMAYRDLIKHPNPKIRKRWEQAGMNEFARLAQGHGDVEGMNVVTFIAKHEMPDGKKATYARYVVDYRPEKDEPWRLRITCGGDRLEYFGDTTTHSATMETIKCQLNSIVSTAKAKAATGDISNMYLGSDLPESEYVRFRISLIPEAFRKAYNLDELATADGYVYARVNKAWYGLKQAGKIAHDDLVERLAEAGYKKAPLVEGYFRHETRPIDFTLVVDDFLIKYTREEDLEHLRTAIGKYYKFKVDIEAKQYVGIHLKWDYTRRTVRLSMNGYVKQALLEFEHEAPSRACLSPSPYAAPRFGSRVQFAKVDDTPPLGPEKITFIQRVVGKLLYYARAVDHTMLHAINDISLSAAKGTEATMAATVHLLNYAHTNPETEIIYRASDMILHVDSDAAYDLVLAPEAKSRAGGYQYLSNKKGTLFNGPVLVLAKVIKNVMASAAEAELAALFMNGQEAVGLRNCLGAMGYPQPATPMKTDNNTASGIVNNTMKQKRSKAIDVRFYWLRDRVQQGQFYIYWDSGKNNLGDFYTKHHPPAYHKQMRPVQTYVDGVSPESLQGCIKMMNEEQSKEKALSLYAAQPQYLYTC